MNWITRSRCQPSKFNFNLSLKELMIITGRKIEQIQISAIHRRRRYSCNPKPLERSTFYENKFNINWTTDHGTTGTISFDATLFKKNPKKEQFHTKEWTLVAEEVTKNGKIIPLAEINLNLRCFVDGDTGLTMKMNCLQKEIKSCRLSLTIKTTLLNNQHFMDSTFHNDTSVLSSNAPPDISLPDHSDWIPDGDQTSTRKGCETESVHREEHNEVDSLSEAKKPPATSRVRYVPSEIIKPSPSLQVQQTLDMIVAEIEKSNVDEFVAEYKAMLNLYEKLEEVVQSAEDACEDAKIRLKYAEQHLMEAKEALNQVFPPPQMDTETDDCDECELVKINEESRMIAERLMELENLQQYVEEKIRNVEPGSEDEQKYISQHLKLINEKDSLIQRQHILQTQDDK